jgi:hypothetical protein
LLPERAARAKKERKDPAPVDRREGLDQPIGQHP